MYALISLLFYINGDFEMDGGAILALSIKPVPHDRFVHEPQSTMRSTYLGATLEHNRLHLGTAASQQHDGHDYDRSHGFSSLAMTAMTMA
jgi:hypothetical protein